MKDFFEEMMGAQEVLQDVYPKIAEIKSKVAFQSFIGTLVDSWCGAREMTSEETFELLQEVCDVQKSVHEQLGVMKCADC